MEEKEMEQRIAALKTRIRIEDFAFQCLAVAEPYLNDEDKAGWKAGDVLKFLRSEIDPEFLKGRQVSISLEVPESKNPTPDDYEALDWLPVMSEPNINIIILNEHWQSMGQLLHRDFKLREFDIEKASKRIEAANKFCDEITTSALFVQTRTFLVEKICCEGHITRRNGERLKVGQIIPCLNNQCKSVFIVKSINPLVWVEFRMQIACDDCGFANCYQPAHFTRLSYWEKASVPCLNENCGNRIEVQWVLCKAISNNNG